MTYKEECDNLLEKYTLALEEIQKRHSKYQKNSIVIYNLCDMLCMGVLDKPTFTGKEVLHDIYTLERNPRFISKYTKSLVYNSVNVHNIIAKIGTLNEDGTITFSNN